MNNIFRSHLAIALRTRTLFTPKRVVELLRSRVLPESVQEFIDFSDLNEKDAHGAWREAKAILDRCATHGITAMAIGDSSYPKRLEELQYDSKYRLCGFCPILYCKGNPDGLNAASTAAIVGTRDPTEHGRKTARRVGVALAKRGVAVVSGLALGCDTEAHLGCLEAKGIGVAVLAHGLDHIYPKANMELAERLVDGGGCLVSEYPPGTPPDRRRFAYRDRIQSGLADTIIVVETPEKDGTMHTANYADKQGRALACVIPKDPAMDGPKTAGNRLLLKEKRANKVSDAGEAVQFVIDSNQNMKSPMVQGSLL